MSGARGWVVVIPDPGVGWINANRPENRYARARRIKAWRQAAAQYARGARVPRLQRAHLLVTFHHQDTRRRDADNLAPTVKAVVDGLVDAHVLPDDSDRYLLGPDKRTGEPVARHRPVRMVVVITELDVDDPDPLTTLRGG